PKHFTTAVSSNRLDVSYILPNLAACSSPVSASKFSVGRLLQNNIDDLITILNTNHGSGNWKLINLRSEKLGYKPSCITDAGGQFEYWPFLDHNILPFNQLLRIIRNIEEYLSESPKNVVVLHCRHGKGRTGSVVVGYLMFKYAIPFELANGIFVARRKLFRTGVSICSQVRYLKYLETFLADINKQNLYRSLVKQESCFTIRLWQLAIIEPDQILQKGIHELNVELGKLVKEGASKELLYKFNSKKEISKMDDNIIIFEPDKELSFQDADISIQFGFGLNGIISGAVGRVWLNFPFEYIRHLLELPSFNINEFIKDDESFNSIHTQLCKVVVPWCKMDGYKGTKKKGLNMFSSIELYFDVQMKTSDDFAKILKQ
ncbi:hypothetical protein CANARDRAFT_187102, partial [[Candida] arabinofermentans NRRL YB-2248]